jgi:hypothetical protein
VLHDLLAVEEAENGVGVTDIDGEQHGGKPFCVE